MQRIAIVDDNPLICSVLGDLLAMEGYEAVALGGPDQLAARLAALQPDLVLLDVLLGPWGDGLALAADLRATPLLATTPIILMTGAPDLLARRGVDPVTLRYGVIDKPFDFDALLACIANALSAQRADPDAAA